MEFAIGVVLGFLSGIAFGSALIARLMGGRR